MNRIGIFILLCALCVLSACKKNDNSSRCKDFTYDCVGFAHNNNGITNVWLNGHIWRPSYTYASIEPNTDSLIKLQIINVQGNKHTELDIKDIKLNTQRQTIVTAYLLPFRGLDVLWPVKYFLLATNPDSNYIQITQHNDNFSELRGTFQLTFYQNPQAKNSGFSDTLKFYNGSFHIPDINQKDWKCN